MTLRKDIDALIKRYERTMSREFLNAVASITSAVRFNELVKAIESQDLNNILSVLDLDIDALYPLTSAYTAAFAASGAVYVAYLPTKRFDVTVYWNATNPRAVEYLQSRSSAMVQYISRDSLNAVRLALAEGFSQGMGPRQIALGLVGRVQAGKRVGGVLGLNEQQARAVINMRKKLNDGDFSYVLGLTKRDKRFDSLLRKGEPLTQAQIDKMVERYADRLLKLRGDTIARTETAQAVEASRMEATQQMLDKSGVDDKYIIRRWDHIGGKTSRDWHSEMNGWKVQGMSEPFVTPRGAQMMFPLDTSLGAGADEIVNCFLPTTKIHPIGIKNAIRSEYSGSIVQVSCGSNVNLTVTANHPVLTQRGWVKAIDIVKGDNLIECIVSDDRLSSKPEIQDVIPTAEQLYDSASSLQSSVRASRAVVNFHGEVPDHDVDIVSFPRILLNAVNTDCSQAFGDISLSETDIVSSGEVVFRHLLLSKGVSSVGLNRVNGVNNISSSLFLGHLLGASAISFGVARTLKPHVRKALVNKFSTLTNLFRDSKNRKTIIEQGFNFFKKFRPIFNAFSSSRGPKVGVVRCSTEVSNAVFGKAVGFANLASNGARGKSFVMERSDSIKENTPSFFKPFRGDVSVKVTSVDSIVISHYEGSVYNFESANGLLISDNIITHNCRCMMTINIDYAAMERDGL